MEALRKMKEEVEGKKKEALRKVKEGIETKKEKALTMVKEEVEAKKDALMKVKEGVEAKTEETLRKVKKGLGAKTEEALMKVVEEVEAKKEAFMKVKEDVEAKRDAFMKVKEKVEAKKKEALMMVKGGVEAKADEALMKLMEELEEKRDAFMKVKEDIEAKKEAFMKVMEVAEASKMDALMMVKEGVEAKTQEALMKVLDEVENKKEAFMKVKEDVEEKIEPVKTFILQALGGSNYKTNIIPTFSTTINTAVAAAATAFEYHSDSSDSCKGSAESLNHEKVKAKSKRQSSKIGDTVPSIFYPVVNSPPVDYVVIQQSQADGTFHPGLECSGVQESAVKKHPAGYAFLEQGSTSGHGIVDLGIKTADGVTEIYLENLHQKQESHKFFCPNCMTSITKVLITREILPETEKFRCTNCFSFFNPAGNWVRNIFGPKIQEIPATGSGHGAGLTEPLLVPSRGTDGSLAIPMPPDEQPRATAEPRSSKSWQILKSIVYGGLAESITSLGIVTSAASADAATLNIIALALANLIGGLFIIVHNLWEFKNDDSTVKSEETGEQVNRYQEVLGKKENFILHATAAMLSFLIFGLVPPVVYGLSFGESDGKDRKIAAVAGASLTCITLLALAKARTQRNPKYILTVVQYVGVGFAVSGASYVAGDLLDKLLEKLGWF